MSSVLKWTSVTKELDSTLIFDRADLEISRGEFVAVVGPSGVGKTTMVMLSTGILTPDSGEIYLVDARIDSMSRDQKALFRRKHVGIVFQFFNLIPTFTVLENIMFPLELNGYSHRDAREKAIELLREFNLLDKKDRFPSSLSGGEQQRVAVLRAVVHNPDVVFADEPTGNLDEENKVLVFDLFKHFNSLGTTIVVVTHDLDLAEKYAHRIIRIKNRRFLEA